VVCHASPKHGCRTLAAVLGLCLAGALLGQTSRRPLVVNESRYRVVAGERIPIEASFETVTFMRTAKTRMGRASTRTFPVAPNVAGDQVLLGIPLTAEPGDYAISVSFINDAGEERSTTLQVTVEPLAAPAAGSTAPPVVLLDGWQAPGATGCPMSEDSTGTFGNLASYLYGSPNCRARAMALWDLPADRLTLPGRGEPKSSTTVTFLSVRA
jgi:hypothetical protein